MTEIQEILEENKVQAESFCEWFDEIGRFIAYCQGYATKFNDPTFNRMMNNLLEEFIQEDE